MNNLYIVSTPIGNLQDITIRGVMVLNDVDYILTEDVGKTNLLLSEINKRFGQLAESRKKPKIIQFNEYIENERIHESIKLLEQGYDLALVSEAGTPLISDPGFKLIRYALSHNIKLTAVPGASAVTASLVCSGLPTDKLLFIGFLPKTEVKKEKYFTNLKKTLEFMKVNNLNPTVVFFESPHRITETFEVFKRVFGDIKICISRELTKIHEENICGLVSGFIEKYKSSSPKGEFTLLFNLKSDF